MKYFILFITILVAMVCSAQEHDFDKHAYKFVRADNHTNDPRVFHYDVGFYFIDLEMTNTSVAVNGHARIDLNLLESYDNELVFELKSNMIVDSVSVNGINKSYIHDDDIIVIDYTHADDFNENYQVSAVVYYHGSPSDGLFNKYNWYSTNIYYFTYSLSEPYSAKYWFPCKQVLNDKADSSYFYITIPEHLKAGSNGLLANEYSIGDSKKRMEWRSSYPIVYYLISVAVGKYQDYSFIAEIPQFETSVLVQNYIPDNSTYLNDNSWSINRTESMLQLLSEKLGLYPHHDEKYGHCIVPLGGGMEHQTMTTLGNFGFRLVIHELGHTWFGNYVTCGTWQDIWINEGFASYTEYLGEEFIQPDGYQQAWLEETQGLARETPTGSVYVPFEQLNDVSRIFNYRLSYRKGACLVHMIRYIVNNDDLFFQTLREFISVYANSTATGEDFKEILETETGIDFTAFYDEWYYGGGFPIYETTWYAGQSNVQVNLLQTTASQETELFTTPLEFKIIFDDDSFMVSRQEITANQMQINIPVAGNVVDLIVNPDKAVLAETITIQTLNPINIKDLVEVFPSPASDYIQIKCGSGSNYKIEILNISGQIIYKNAFEGNNHTIDAGGISQGVYFVKVFNDYNTQIEKIVIN